VSYGRTNWLNQWLPFWGQYIWT